MKKLHKQRKLKKLQSAIISETTTSVRLAKLEISHIPQVSGGHVSIVKTMDRFFHLMNIAYFNKPTILSKGYTRKLIGSKTISI